MPLRATDWSAEAIPQFDQHFQRTNGWIGADGDFTVALTNDVTLWLFSDTFVGQVRDGHRVHATMVNNTAAWQRGTDPVSTQATFFTGKTAKGRPKSLITPANGKGWFWQYDGLMASGHLFLFLEQFERTADNSAFGFRQTGVTLGEVSNPLAPPTQWHVAQRAVPFGQFGTSEDHTFGSAVLAADGYVYIYGVHEPGNSKRMILARVPEARLADFSAWEFRSDNGWTTDAGRLADLCYGVANEYSVSWLPALQRYVLICTENGLSDKIMARTAPEPWGPWDAGKVVWRCPEMSWDKNIFCYAAKAHPMLATQPDELVITYAANSYSIAQVVQDARLYWPRFVRVRLAGDGH